jgi:hypothetical protein
MTIKIPLISFLIFFVAGLTGCLESSFQLSEQSRLPRWFSVPHEANRSDYTLQMDLHSTTSGGKAVFKLSKKGNLLSVGKYVVTTDEQPSIRSVQLSRQPEGSPKDYPRYKVVTINGVTDIIELRKMEPVFYMTDDPAVWENLGVKRQ